MTQEKVRGSGTKGDPWQLKTPSGSSEFQMYREETANPPALVCTVGKTELRYHLRCLEDSARHAQGARRLDAAWAAPTSKNRLRKAR